MILRDVLKRVSLDRKRVSRTGQWLRNRLASRAVVLCYHRVVELASDPISACVASRHSANIWRSCDDPYARSVSGS
jgi:hypothetical protein